MRTASRRFVFRDIRGVDELLEFLIVELGWKPPVRKGKALQFKPTLKTVLVWGPVKFVAWVDGCAVTVTGPKFFVRRLGKTLLTYTEGGTVAAT